MTKLQTATFTVASSAPAPADLVVNLASSGYTSGLVMVPANVTLPKNASSVTFIATAVSQPVYPTQDAVISLATGTGYIVGSPSTLGLLITDGAYVFKGEWSFANGLSSSVAGAPAWTVTGNVPIVNGSLSFPGNYMQDFAELNATSILNQNVFTLGISFQMADVSTNRIIIAGGPSYRWLILRCDPPGTLSVDLNNHSVHIPLGSFAVTAGTDHTLLLSIDTSTLSLVAYLDGVRFSTSLPGGFVWNNPSGTDLYLLSDDLSNATTFKGLWNWVFIASGVLP
jgi:hypothetical protein